MLGRWLCWIWDRLHREPRPLLASDCRLPRAGAVRVRIIESRTLDPEQVGRQGGERSGRAWWWLRGWNGEFVLVDLPRGDQPIDVTLYLEPGRYTLGVARGDDAIRRTIRVRE